MQSEKCPSTNSGQVKKQVKIQNTLSFALLFYALRFEFCTKIACIIKFYINDVMLFVSLISEIGKKGDRR